MEDDNNEWVHASPYGHLHLRDLFAAFALAGLAGFYPQGGRSFADTVAPMAYEYADAMLAQRAKAKEQS